MSSEGKRIWSIKIDWAASSLITSSFTLLMILQIFLTPLILIQHLTHYDSQHYDSHSLEAVSHSSLSQVIRSSHLSTYFSHDESLCFVLLLIFFLIYHLICHAFLRWNFLEYSSDSLMSNCSQIPEMLLSHLGLLLAQLLSARSQLNNLDYSIRICHHFSSRSEPL